MVRSVGRDLGAVVGNVLAHGVVVESQPQFAAGGRRERLGRTDRDIAGALGKERAVSPVTLKGRRAYKRDYPPLIG